MLLLALILFAVAGVLLALAEDRAHRHVHSQLALAWLDGFALPLGRVFALMLFIACAYPALYGLRDLPSFATLLSLERGRFDHLLTALFVAGLLLPAIPLLRRALGLILPLQGMAGVALVGHWCAGALGTTLKLWPTPATWMALALAAVFAQLLAVLLTRTIDDPLLQEDARDLLLLWLQAPVLLVYGQYLGHQLR
jgi:hypothetical protein